MATKTIENMHFYVPITTYTYEDREFHTLRVSVRYCKGRGFQASFTPGWGDSYGWGCVIDGSDNPLTAGITVEVEPATKNNSKRIAEMTESLKMAKDIIAALFDDREWEKLKAVLHNVARFGYVEQYKEQAEKYLAERVSKRYEKAVKPTEPVVKQVDVMGLMGALQTKGKAKLSDFATPIESETNNENNNQNSTTMAQNVKAADLIGKTIVVGDNQATIVINGVDGDKLSGEFTKDGKTTPLSFPVSQLQGMTEKGLWKLQTSDVSPQTSNISTEADVAEVQDIVPVVTKKKSDVGSMKSEEKPQPSDIKPQTSNQPAAKVEPIKATVKPEPKPKAKTQTSAVSPQTSGKYVYATYQTSKGKTGAKITGFASEDDVFYAMAADIHASGSYDRDKDGNKHYYLLFGPRYAEAAKSICKVLNSDKTVNQKVAECKLIVSQATEDLATKREEWKQKREERKAAIEREQNGTRSSSAEREQARPNVKAQPSKDYSKEDVADMLKKIMAGGDVPEDIKKLLQAA